MPNREAVAVGHGVAEPAAADRVASAADVVGAGAPQGLDADAHVVGRDPGVAVDAADDVAARGADGDVQRGRHDAARIAQAAARADRAAA